MRTQTSIRFKIWPWSITHDSGHSSERGESEASLLGNATPDSPRRESLDNGVEDAVTPGESSIAHSRPSIDDRRREIAATAARLFDRTGYSQTTMEDIAQAVGLGKSTLYHYFISKDEILFWIHEEFIDHLIERHEKRLEARLNANVLLLEVMADILELMQTHRGHVRVFFEHHRELPLERQETIKTKRDHYEAMIEDIFVTGIDTGEFRDTDPKLISLAMFGMCNWAYQWYRPQGPLRTREIAYSFWSYLVHGVGTTGLELLPEPD
jgi:AcrR family transcriptional regulator